MPNRTRPDQDPAHCDRRSFLRLAGAALAGAIAPGHMTPLESIGPARLGPIGVQLYTVREALRRDFEGTLARVARIGYSEVEFAGYFGRSPRDVRSALDRAGLTAPGAHVAFETLRDELAATLDAARTIGHGYLVSPGVPAEYRSADGMARAAEVLNGIGAAAGRSGVVIAYHNYASDVTPGPGGAAPYDVLLARTDPALVRMEMDLYWMAKGGGDALGYFARYPGRFPLAHVKDMDGTREHGMADVGAGVMDWRRIFARRAQAGVRHWFVEHDAAPDPFATLAASYAYLRALRFRDV